MHAPSQTLPSNSLGRQSQSNRNNDQRQQQLRNPSSNNSNNPNRRQQQSNINSQNSQNSRKPNENARTPSQTSTYSHASQQSNYSSASRNPIVRSSSSASQSSFRNNNNNNNAMQPSSNPIPHGNTLNSLKRSQQQQQNQHSQQISSATSSSTTTITSPHNSSSNNRAVINERLRLASNPSNNSDVIPLSDQDQSSQFYEREHEYRTYIHFIELIYHVFVFGLVGFLIAACILKSISYIFPFAVLFLYDGINILRTLQRFRIYRQYKCRFKSKIIMMEIVFLILTKLVLLPHFIAGTNSIFAMIPIACYCVLRGFIYKIEKHSEDCNSIINFLLIGHRVFVFIFMGSVALKLDKFVGWEWSQTIWSYWVMFSILIGLTFGSFLMTLSKCFQVCLAESHLDELKGIFWVFMNVSGVTAGSFLLLLGTIRYFDAKEKIALEILMIFLGSFFIVYFFISVLWRKSIMKYMKQMSSFDPEYVRQQSKNEAEEEQRVFANRQAEIFGNSNNGNGNLRARSNNNINNNGNTRNLRNQQENSNDQGNNNPSNQQEKQVDEEEEKSNGNNEQSPVYVPRFLEKFSNTFFRKTDPTLNPTEYIKQKQQEKDEKKKQRNQILKSQQVQKKQQQQLAASGGSMSSSQTNETDSKKSSTQNNNNNGKSQQKQTKILRNESTISSSQQSDVLSRRSSSSIVLNVHNPHPSKLAELLSQFKKGASSLIRSIRPIGGVGSGQGLPGGLSTQACQQLPITEPDEIKTQGNDDIIEFMTTEESQEPQKQINPGKQNININQQKLRTRKEQHVSIIEPSGNLPGLQVQNQLQNRCHSLAANEDQNDQLMDQREAANQQQQIAQKASQIDIDQYNNINNHRRFLSVQEKNTENGIPGMETSQQSGDNRINYQNNCRQSIESVKNGGLQILTDGVEEEYSVVSDTNRDNLNENNNNIQQSSNNVNGQHDHSQINDQSSILSSSRVDKSSANTCLVCFDKPPDSVFMDCGHGGVCYECSLEIWKKTGECYLCRLKIAQVLQVDLKSKAYGLMKVISSTQMVQKDVDTSDIQQESQNASRQQQQGPLEEIQEDNQE